ncbi:hypothetical protein BCR43DRAFT_494484 [Syncephalastrum racemosum]|uniref:Uncharacterized protein n=1 Tax=Syncephalastrum racemosum TaxID=13706 RepID=A0A1X2H815_SYNRA|nr:hypothetical protein BCR43DRAFT_494484 [Syncephalastrum racemosum]
MRPRRKSARARVTPVLLMCYLLPVNFLFRLASSLDAKSWLEHLQLSQGAIGGTVFISFFLF